jgi:MFS family permease
MAMGINMVAAIAGQFFGLVIGGLLADVDWRLIFWVNVPVGVFGTVWAYLKLREVGARRQARMDWWGNVTFAVGLILVLVGITYGIQPYGGHSMGWTSPTVLAELLGGLALLVVFVLFHIRAFVAGNLANFMTSIGRGGLQFMLIIWLQGIWLPLHGYNFVDTPLWAGIYMLPLTVGMLLAGPTSGYLSDRFGARPFATGGMIGAAISFALLMLLPTDFSFPVFAAILFLNGISMGMFASPNRAAVMNSLPPGDRGAGGGMNQTFQNSAQVLSIGIFFTLLIIGLADTLPETLSSGLQAHGVSAAAAHHAGQTPPISVLFAAFLGYNPVQHLVGASALAGLPAHAQAVLTGHSFFPHLISAPFKDGLHTAFTFAIIACLVAAAASLLRGGRYHHAEEPAPRPAPCHIPKLEEQHAR